MSTSAQFLKLSPQETVCDEWEILDDSGRLTASELVKILVGVAPLLLLGLRYFGVPGVYELTFFIPFQVLWLAAPVAAIWLALVFWQVVIEPARKGYLCLTNWRCLYYEQGRSWWKSYYRVVSVDLGDIVGVHTVYEKVWLGIESIMFVIYTKFEDQIGIQIGDRGGWLAKIPVLRRLFVRKSMGKDALRVPPVLFDRIRERLGTAADTRVSY